VLQGAAALKAADAAKLQQQQQQNWLTISEQ
jgi:hypothetical protein